MVKTGEKTDEKNSYGAIPTAEPIPEDDVPLVKVVAPSDMMEGFKFRAIYDGVAFPVIVPAGGCAAGQVLTVPFNPKADDMPSRFWKDDIFSCFRYGVCHPSSLLACCCPLILLGQVMTRLKLDWLARPDGDWKQTFKIMVCIAIGFGVLDAILSPADPEEPCSPIYSITMFIYTLFSVYVMMKTRKIVRENDLIGEQTCKGCEDIVCSFFCGCCTASQLARQTADYELDEGQFFTPTGLPDETAPISLSV
jgi:Cys-rich protein (TIGR01571 family)